MNDIDIESNSDDGGKRKRNTGFVIPWPVLSTVLLVVALASVAALVIVATITKADTLATVALVLAILAFGTQLIVTAAQTMSANEQYREVNRLYEDTRSVLKRIRMQSKMLLSNQSDQFNKILDHVLSPGAIESAVAEATGESENDAERATDSSPAPEVANEISKLLRAQAERALQNDQNRGAHNFIRRSMAEPDEMRRFPSEDEARETVARFQALSDDAKKYLLNIANRFNENPDQRMRITQIHSGPVSELPPYLRELETAGFVSFDPLRASGKSRTGRRITQQGITAIRFFTGQGVVPVYLRDVVGESGSA